jgi:hypothetical protein
MADPPFSLATSWPEFVVGALGGPILWARMMARHTGRPYTSAEHLTAVAALILTFSMLVWIFRRLAMALCDFASFGEINRTRAWQSSGLVAGAIVVLQLACVTFLPVFVAAAGTMAVLGVGYAVLARWAGRQGREKWLPAVLFAAFTIVALLVVYYLRYRLSGGPPLFLSNGMLSAVLTGAA